MQGFFMDTTDTDQTAQITQTNLSLRWAHMPDCMFGYFCSLISELQTSCSSFVTQRSVSKRIQIFESHKKHFIHIV